MHVKYPPLPLARASCTGQLWLKLCHVSIHGTKLLTKFEPCVTKGLPCSLET